MYSSGAQFRQTEGRKKVVSLSVAAKMANTRIEQKSYELHEVRMSLQSYSNATKKAARDTVHLL